MSKDRRLCAVYLCHSKLINVMYIIKYCIQIALFACLVFIALIICAEVIFRNSGRALPGATELALLAAAWTYFLGMAHATFSDTHITGGLEELIASKHLRILCQWVQWASLLLFSLFALYFSIVMFVTSAKAGYSTVYLGIPSAIFVLALVVGFLLNILFIIMRLIRYSFKPK